MNEAPSELVYAGFWPRLGSKLLDFLILLPLAPFMIWGERHFRLFDVYRLVPMTLFSIFYFIFLVARLGGTPGKLLMGIRIAELDGSAVTTSAAIIRQLPELVLATAAAVALCAPLLEVSDAQYAEIASSTAERSRFLRENAPPWYQGTSIVFSIWVWGELVVLLTNRKRRALHDFLAGTVVLVTRRTGLGPRRGTPASAAQMSD
ncbi:MAG: RDD family protein [Proteobacteria bacterium]|nr:RDD family protein [Pseudomonadota bacterium]